MKLYRATYLDFLKNEHHTPQFEALDMLHAILLVQKDLQARKYALEIIEVSICETLQ